MNKQMMVYMYNGIVSITKTIDTRKNMDGLQIILLNERFQTTKEYILNGSTYIKLENTNLTECRSVPAFESGSRIWEQV